MGSVRILILNTSVLRSHAQLNRISHVFVSYFTKYSHLPRLSVYPL